MGKHLTKVQKKINARRVSMAQTIASVGPTKASAYKMPGSMRKDK